MKVASIGDRSAMLVAAAALVATAMPPVGAEVIERPGTSGLGGWLRKNNRVRRERVKVKRSQPNQRLAPATGPGSYNEWKAQLAAERAVKRPAQSESECQKEGER